MSNTFPAKYGFISAVPHSYDATQTNGENQYNSYTNKQGQQQYFGFDLTIEPLLYDEAMGLYGWLVGRGGRHGVWNLPNPMRQIGNGQFMSLGLRARVAAGKGSNKIVLTNGQPLARGAIKMGDFLQPTANRKTYIAQNDVDFDVDGFGQVEVYPPLYNAVSGNEPINFGDDVMFQVELMSDVSDIAYAASQRAEVSLTIDVKERG
jgi:hypothetical protein